MQRGMRAAAAAANPLQYEPDPVAEAARREAIDHMLQMQHKRRCASACLRCGGVPQVYAPCGTPYSAPT